ncbi:MAG: asparagine synthase (glutamine-hydrolyzing) [Blastocatellia bacterium]|nr:MAG: asparagine synthase (glutamine-hydrolyzing) [Blastocatellia bacterium]
MCSISGIIKLSKSQCKEELSRFVSRMNSALRHRGPDDRGMVNINAAAFAPDQSISVSLGNTRLAIIDVSSAGHQPMHDPETGNWLTYNGETYNYRQLRSELGDEFGPWRSNTDTEVVLRAYRKWGVDAFARMRGMFALAIWDQNKRSLVLARDQFGIKPLYCFFGSSEPLSATSSTIASNMFMFSSEVRALLASDLVPRTLSLSGLSSLLEFGSVQAPLTIVNNVWSLMPATCLTVTEKSESQLGLDVVSFKIGRTNTRASSRQQAKAELRRRLEDSLKQHLVSDVPLGIFLSGGMDSSATVALMSQVTSERPRTFSVVFSEREFTESEHSQAIATKFNTDHCEIRLSEQSLISALPDALGALDQPTMDGINTYVVSKAVKESGATVALSGLGGDELFGGYPSFHRALRMEAASGLMKGVLRSVARVGSLANESKAILLAASNGEAAAVYRISRQLFSTRTVQELAISPVKIDESYCYSNDERDTVNLISRLEMHGYMSNTLLRDTDSVSMANSLEVRVPFVDKEVADCVLSMPGNWKLNQSNGHQSKPLLAETLADLLPPEVLYRPKMGFTLPFEKWMTLQLKDHISSVFADTSQLNSSGLRQDSVNHLWRRFLRRPKSVGWSRPWTLYVLAKWCQLNNVRVALEQ